MFIDKVKIKITGGNGGHGRVSFLRDKRTTNGGPDGGDGGRGGDIVFVATKDLNTLMDFRYNRKFKAEDGEGGKKKNASGKYADHLYIKVPVGTVIREAETGKIMADLTKDGEERIIIKGGRGGLGNQHFATAKMQTPKYAQNGQQSKSYDVILELKLLADVGIIGMPNVGKSTLLSMATNANPKIANYHFTTLTPNLGVVRSKWGKDFVIADIPGLVEGASEGVGLGHDFLRHVERTKVFIHVLDFSEENPLEPMDIILNELENYKPALLDRPRVIAANKMDIEEARENFAKIKADVEIIPISAATNSGIDELLSKVAKILEETPDDITFEEDYEEFTEGDEIHTKFTVELAEAGDRYVVEGEGLRRMLGYTNLDTEKGFAFFQRYLREKGIIDALDEAGITEGDTVQMYDLLFDYYK